MPDNLALERHRIHRTADPWVGRLQNAAERRSPEAAFWLEGLVGAGVTDDDHSRLFRGCESPIEAAMLIGLVVVAVEYGLEAVVVAPRLAFDSGKGGPQLLIDQQMPIATYRADFAIGMERLDARIVIECDGAAYHEAAEAKARDAKRDARISALWGPTLRFTGRQLWADPFECAERALLALA